MTLCEVPLRSCRVMLHMWLRDVPSPGVHDLAALVQ